MRLPATTAVIVLHYFLISGLSDLTIGDLKTANKVVGGPGSGF
jgi:hypothetical protein